MHLLTTKKASHIPADAEEDIILKPELYHPEWIKVRGNVALQTAKDGSKATKAVN